MTVKDICEVIDPRPMAKKQKTDSMAPVAKDVHAPGSLEEPRISELMLGTIMVATRTPDMNIVDFSDDISDIEITPGPEPLSDSDLPPRPKKNKKKKKKHSKEEKSKKMQTDNETSQNKDGPNESTDPGAQSKS